MSPQNLNKKNNYITNTNSYSPKSDSSLDRWNPENNKYESSNGSIVSVPDDAAEEDT